MICVSATTAALTAMIASPFIAPPIPDRPVTLACAAQARSDTHRRGLWPEVGPAAIPHREVAPRPVPVVVGAEALEPDLCPVVVRQEGAGARVDPRLRQFHPP